VRVNCRRSKSFWPKDHSVDEALESLAKGLSQKMLHGAMVQLNSKDPIERDAPKRLWKISFSITPTKPD
jgi:hypothetical protein